VTAVVLTRSLDALRLAAALAVAILRAVVSFPHVLSAFTKEFQPPLRRLVALPPVVNGEDVRLLR
jgi:hypothetical protein